LNEQRGVNRNGIQPLVRSLSASEFRTVKQLAGQQGCDIIELKQQLETLRELGVEIEDAAGRGYRLCSPQELLDRSTILAGLCRSSKQRLSSLHIELSVDSTNSALRRLPLAEQHATAILAEHQSSGRGRHGRAWHSPFGGNLYLSLGWRFDKPMSALGSLALVVALAAAESVQRLGLSGHGIKWPNDLVLDGRKLCGCLVELQGNAQGPCDAVLGVGINVHMPAQVAGERIDQPWTDLRTHLPACSRNDLATILLDELIRHITRFSEQGFAPFMDAWQQWDTLHGQNITVHKGDDAITGEVVGVDVQGGLLLDTGSTVLKLHSGEVSLRETKI